MNIELTRFRVEKGKSQRFDEWMSFIDLETEVAMIQPNIMKAMDSRNSECNGSIIKELYGVD
jgi:hypothetical protein